MKTNNTKFYTNVVINDKNLKNINHIIHNMIIEIVIEIIKKEMVIFIIK